MEKIDEQGKSVLHELPNAGSKDTDGVWQPWTGHGGGNSGAVISPASGLGLSAYQDPKSVPEKKPGMKEEKYATPKRL